MTKLYLLPSMSASLFLVVSCLSCVEDTDVSRRDHRVEEGQQLEALYQEFREDMVKQQSAGVGTLIMPEEVTRRLADSVARNRAFWREKAKSDFDFAVWVLRASPFREQFRVRSTAVAATSPPSSGREQAWMQQVWMEILADQPPTQ